MGKLAMWKQAIEAGDYNIRTEKSCMCSPDVQIIGDRLNIECSGDDCWVSNILSIGDEDIIHYDQYDTLEPMSYSVPDKKDQQELIAWILALSCPTCLSVLEDMDCDHENNTAHDEAVHDALVSYIMDNGYGCDIEYPRGFANEYTCILIEGKGCSQEEAEDWANSYLAKNDDATKMYISFRIDDED